MRPTVILPVGVSSAVVQAAIAPWTSAFSSSVTTNIVAAAVASSDPMLSEGFASTTAAASTVAAPLSGSSASTNVVGAAIGGTFGALALVLVLLAIYRRNKRMLPAREASPQYVVGEDTGRLSLSQV